MRDKTEGVDILKVKRGGIASEVGLEKGDRIVSINGHPLKDVIDYQFWAHEPELVVDVKKPDGERWSIEIEKDEGEPLGLEFPPLTIRRCPNKCVFCFVDQMAPGLRKTLYIRDEDYRFSFLHGSYITLTNLTSADKKRIVEKHLSPLYISVHATDPELRRYLLQNPKAPDVMEEMRFFTGHGITMHTQIVLCPGINDGEHLEKTVEDLAGLWPGVQSIAVVPVGVTRFREGDHPLRSITRAYAKKVLSQTARWQKRFLKEYGEKIIFPADEFFIKAGEAFPPLEYYEELPQLENGVGLVPLFMEGLEREMRKLARWMEKRQSSVSHVRVALPTGESFAPYLKTTAEALAAMTGVTLEVIPVRNLLFGPSVTVTGLLSSDSILSALKGGVWDAVLLPSVTMRDEKDTFIDGMTLREFKRMAGVPVQRMESSARGLVAATKKVMTQCR